MVLAAQRKPTVIPAAPSSKQVQTPQRSDIRPINNPPAPKPIQSSVEGNEASERETPNSACTSGNTTDTTNMQLLPITMIASAVTSRQKA